MRIEESKTEGMWFVINKSDLIIQVKFGKKKAMAWMFVHKAIIDEKEEK